MSKQANKKAIGAFVVVALALAVLAIIVFGSGKFFVKTYQYVAFFQGSVKGLRIGAPVMFRGVNIGEVTKIMIYADYHDRSYEIPVFMKISEDNFHPLGQERIKDYKQYLQDLIQSGLRAQLQLQSIVTGQLMINVDFFPNTPLKLVGDKTKIKIAKNVMEVPTIPSAIQKIEKTLTEVPIDKIAQMIEKSLEHIEDILTSKELTRSLQYFEQSMKNAQELTSKLDQKIDPLLVNVDRVLKDGRLLIRKINNQVDPLASSLKQTSDSANAAFGDIRKLTNNIDGQVNVLAGSVAKTLQEAELALATVTGTLEEGSPLRFQVENTLEELAQAARALRTLADYLERHPDALLRGKPETGGRK
jgi:paraquat-inducible protein B